MMIGSYPIGSTAICGALNYNDGTPFILLLSGVDQSPRYDMRSLTWQRSLGGQAKVKITLWDQARTFRPQVGELAQLHIGSEKVFSGSVEEVRESQRLAWTGKANKVSLTLVDHERLADRYIFAKNYEDPDQTMREVVQDSVDVQTPLGSSDLVGLVMGDEGPPLADFLVDYHPFKKFLDQICRVTGHAWSFSAEGDLVVRALAALEAPIELTDANPLYDDIVVKKSRTKYRNRQYLRAGAQKTVDQVSSFSGDGETQTFTLRWPVDNRPDVEKPTVKIDDVAVDSALVGLSGADDDSVFEWLYSIGEREIDQGLLEEPLTSSQKLSVSYVGQVPTIILEELPDEQAARKLVEGGSGRYDNFEEDEDIVDREHAVDMAESFLSRFGEIGEQIDFSTRTKGFAPGQVLKVSLADHGLDKQFLVQNVRVRDRKGTSEISNLWYSVRASAPPRELESWVEYWGRVFGDGRRVAINRHNELLLIVRKSEEQLSVLDEISREGSSTAESLIDDPIESDAFGYAVLGDTTTSSQPSMLIGFAILSQAARYQK